MSTDTSKTDLPGDPESGVAGLEDGGSIVPGDTPPGEDSMSGATGGGNDGPNHGPVAGNRTPMVIALVALALVVLAVLGYGVAEIVGYL